MNPIIKKHKGSAILAAVLVIIAVILTAAGCSANSTNGQVAEGAAQGADTSSQNANQPAPYFPTSAMRQEDIEIEAIQALGTPTTTMFFPMGSTTVNINGTTHYTQPPFKTCASEGEPIPNTASLTNPLTPYQGNINTGPDVPVVNQPDPNGLYAPANSEGTYVLCLTPSGGTKLTYWEGPVFAESGTALFDTSTGTVQDIGPSELPVCNVLTWSGSTTVMPDGTSYTHCVPATATRSYVKGHTKSSVGLAA